MHALASLQQRTNQPVVAGMMSALVAAFCYGSVMVIGRQLVTEYTVPLVASFVSVMFATAIMSTFMATDLSKDRHSPIRGFCFMALAGASGSLGVTSFFFALTHAPITIVSPVAASNPLIALLVAHLFLRRLERVTPRIWLGAALVVSGVILITLSNA